MSDSEVVNRLETPEDEAEQERVWLQFGLEQFAAGYAESDDLYDSL